MWVRGCKACEAKDKEIEHLLALLERANTQAEKANSRLAEMTAPGVNARLEPRPARIAPQAPPTRRVQSFPGYSSESQPEIEVEP